MESGGELQNGKQVMKEAEGKLSDDKGTKEINEKV